jgi:hypothetical protein
MSLLVFEPKLQSRIPVPLPLLQVRLIRRSLVHTHRLPRPLFRLIQPHQPPPLHHQRHERQGADGDENLIAAVVVGRVVFAVDLTGDHGTDLHDHIVGGGREGTLFNGEGVFRYPG